MECDICGENKRNVKCYELKFINNLFDTLFICSDCLNVQLRINELENIDMRVIEL